MGRRTATWAGAMVACVLVIAGGCASSDEPTSLLLSEEELASAPTLRIGDAAPGLAVKEWLGGGPVETFEAGKVYVIDFWASWCGPCLAIMPALAELQTRHKDDGVVVIAMTAVDGMNPRAEVLREMRNVGKGSTVSFALDGGREGNSTAQAYMHASRETGIPRTFVVDQQGRLAWIGHPKDAGEVVAAVRAGTWDLHAAAEARDRETRERTASRGLVDEWRAAKERGDQAAQMAALEELTAMDPENVAHSPSFWLQGEKIKLLREMGDEEGARRAFADGLAEEEFAREPWALAEFAKAMGTIDTAQTDALAAHAEELAVERDARRPTRSWDAFIAKAERPWDTQARQVLSEYWYARGDRDRAIRLIKQAIAETDPRFPRAVEMREGLLRKYESQP